MTRKKTLTKVAFVAMLCCSKMVLATDRVDLQRRDSFKRLEDLRAERKEAEGEDVLYKKRDGELRPHGLMDDVKEPGQSTEIMNAIKEDLHFRFADEALPQRVEEEVLQRKDQIERNKKMTEGRRAIKRHQDRVQYEYIEKERRDAFSQIPQEYEQGAVDEDGRYRNEAIQSVRRHQETLQNEGRVSYQDFIRMDDQQIQKVRTVIIPLSESYFDDYKYSERDAFNRKLEQNRNIMVVLDCAGASHIGDNCLRSVVKANHVKIIHAENVTDIGNDFLLNCRGLTTLDLSPLSNVRDIGNYFLSGCRGLTTLDLSPLSNVTYIGNSFLSDCAGLTSLDLTPFSNVRSIGNDFLFACTGLTTLDLTPLSNVRSIGDSFLSVCKGLTTLDLSPLSNVRSIGHSFLSSCTGLTTLDLSPLSNVTYIGDAFLYHCRGLRTLDLRPLSNVSDIGEYFLADCSGLTRERVTIPENWRFEDRLPQHLRPIRTSVAP